MLSSLEILSRIAISSLAYKKPIQVQGLLEEPVIRFKPSIKENGEKNLQEGIALLEKIYRYRNLSQHDKALALLNNWVCLYDCEPLQPVMLNLRADILREIGNIKLALNDIDEALKLRPEHPFTWFNKGNICYENKNYEEALSAYNKCLELLPGYIPALNNRANVLHGLGHSIEAVGHYRFIIKKYPSDTIAQFNYHLITTMWNIPHHSVSTGTKVQSIDMNSIYFRDNILENLPSVNCPRTTKSTSSHIASDELRILIKEEFKIASTHPRF